MGSIAKSYTVCEEGLPKIWGTAHEYLTIYEEAFVIYDFATDPFWMSLYMRNIWFSFLSVYPLQPEETVDICYGQILHTAKKFPFMFSQNKPQL